MYWHVICQFVSFGYDTKHLDLYLSSNSNFVFCNFNIVKCNHQTIIYSQKKNITTPIFNNLSHNSNWISCNRYSFPTSQSLYLLDREFSVLLYKQFTQSSYINIFQIFVSNEISQLLWNKQMLCWIFYFL